MHEKEMPEREKEKQLEPHDTENKVEGVFVQKIYSENNRDYKLEIQEIGDLDPLAVPTLLKVAARMVEQKYKI